MTLNKFGISKASGIHYQLNLLAGEWQGMTKTWFEPDKLADESPMKGKMTPVLDGRFMLFEYEGSMTGKQFDGIAIIGFSINSDKFQMAWVDSFHMGTDIMFSEGRSADKLFSAIGNYGGPQLPEPWGWRTEIELKDTNTMVVTAYNITPSGEEAKATETIFSRR